MHKALDSALGITKDNGRVESRRKKEKQNHPFSMVEPGLSIHVSQDGH